MSECYAVHKRFPPDIIANDRDGCANATIAELYEVAAGSDMNVETEPVVTFHEPAIELADDPFSDWWLCRAEARLSFRDS